MKKICLLMILLMAESAGFAQNNQPVKVQIHEPVNPMKDKQEFHGYTIRLMPAMLPQSMDSYGFDISKDNEPALHHFRNSLPFLPKGIQKKEDAYKIAKWMIREYVKTSRWQNMVPLHIARELKIENSY